MKSGIKTAVSLLIAILIFGGITVLSSFGMFSTVEKRFYEPARLKAINGKLDSVADCSNAYIDNLLALLGYEEKGFLSSESVASFVNQAPSDEALYLFSSIREKIPGLDGMRIVDSAGRRVHFSSFRNDYTISGNKRNYTNYDVLKTSRGRGELEYSVVTAFGSEQENSLSPRIVFDGEEQRLIFSYRLYSDASNKNGFSAIFYINPYDFINQLIEKHCISVNEQLTLISSSDGKMGGFVFALPAVGQNIFASEIIKKWDEKSFGPDIIVSTEGTNFNGITVNQETGEISGNNSDEKTVSWSLISSSISRYCGIAGLYTNESLEMPGYVRVLLLICAFITVCLVIVILFNVRKDDDVIIRSKIKSVQIGLLNEYFEKDVDRKKVAAMIESQKDALTSKIKKSLGRRGQKYGDDLELILNKSWEDIINILSGAKAVNGTGISSDDMNEIRRMFEEILSSGTLKIQAQSVSAPVQPVSEVQKAGDVEEIEEAEPVEDLEEIEEVESVEEVEPLEEVEPVEDLEEVEPVEEIEDAEPVEDLEEVESVEEVEPLEEVEPVEDLEEVEPVEEIEDAESVEELEEIQEAEPAGDLEDLEEAEPVEDLEEVEEPEAVEDIGEAETVEELEEAEPLEEVEVVSELDDADVLEPVSEVLEAEEVSEIEQNLPAKDGEEDLGSIELEGEQPIIRSLDDTLILQNSVPVEELEPIEEEKPTEISEDDEYKVDKVDDVVELSGYENEVNDEEKSVTYTPIEVYDRGRFEGSEPLEIGDTTASKTDAGDSDLDFEIFKPLDYIFDEDESETDSNEILEEEKDAEDVENESLEDPTAEAVLLELPTEKDGFMFTTFAANDNNVTDLPLDAIVMGEDGVFQISENFSPVPMSIDEDFKKLVDAVTHQ